MQPLPLTALQHPGGSPWLSERHPEDPPWTLRKGAEQEGRAAQHSLEHPAVLRVPHLDPVLPLVPGELVLVHDSGLQRRGHGTVTTEGRERQAAGHRSPANLVFFQIRPHSVYFLMCSISDH